MLRSAAMPDKKENRKAMVACLLQTPVIQERISIDNTEILDFVIDFVKSGDIDEIVLFL